MTCPHFLTGKHAVQVFALFFSAGFGPAEVAGIDLFSFGDDLKITSVASFREGTNLEQEQHLK